eukprot:5810394-Pleurochrysis_carterae.AAC.1
MMLFVDNLRNAMTILAPNVRPSNGDDALYGQPSRRRHARVALASVCCCGRVTHRRRLLSAAASL